MGGTKLERFLPKNQHTQRKFLNFENWTNGEVSKSAKSPNLKWCSIFDTSPLTQFSKFNNFLWVCWFFGKNLSNFAPPIWKLHNPYCHNVKDTVKFNLCSLKCLWYSFMKSPFHKCTKKASFLFWIFWQQSIWIKNSLFVSKQFVNWWNYEMNSSLTPWSGQYPNFGFMFFSTSD